MASAFTASEVFSRKKYQTGTNSLALPLRSSDQLRDHDDTYNEAQALLTEWKSNKLHLELEMEDDDLVSSGQRRSPAASDKAQLATNFDDLYSCLAEEEEHSAVNSILQDLMEQELLDRAMIEELAVDVSEKRKKFRDPVLTMEARHLQVRQNSAQRAAERQKKQREMEARWEAVEEARRKEEMRKKEEAQRQSELLQQEMVRLRHEMQERRRQEQLIRQRERERVEELSGAKGLQSASPLPLKQQQQDRECLYKEQKIQTMTHLRNLKCLQRHFSGWYSVVLDQRLCIERFMALCDWKRKLRAWRAWRALMWTEQRQRDVATMEQQLRIENSKCQQAVENNRRRLLRRCLAEWQLWCRTQRQQRELLSQRQEMRCKMAALINTVSTYKAKAEAAPASQLLMPPPAEASKQPEATEEEGHHRSGPFTPNASAVPKGKTPVATVKYPIQARQVTHLHVAPTAAELQEARRRVRSSGSKSAASQSVASENTYAIQQQIIAQQRNLLKKQQDEIAQLRQEQKMMGLELEVENNTHHTQLSAQGDSRPKSHSFDTTRQKMQTVSAERNIIFTPQRKRSQTCSHPLIIAMEARACQRAERRKEIQETKRKKEEEKLAKLKAAEEQRQREMEEEKRKGAEKKKEEKRQEREREEEKQRQLKRQQDLLELASQHYNRKSLLQRGLVPWKRFIQFQIQNTQLAESHYNLFLLRRCTLGWHQSVKVSLTQNRASADRLYHHFLLRRSLSCWKGFVDWRRLQEERAEHFCHTYTLRRFLLALHGYMTQERLLEWDRMELAEEHDNRRLLQRSFLAWRQLPCIQREERVKEGRRERLARKVAQVLPDFQLRSAVTPLADAATV